MSFLHKVEAKKKEAEPSLKPPKSWFAKMTKKIKKSNPKYTEEMVRKTVGDIWYHNLSKSKKSEIRKREGKTYGKKAA
jgi:beta-xylosidase